MTQSHGHHDPRFQPVVELFEENLASGKDLGASVAITVDGEFVVDRWGGSTAESTPWEKDTLVNVMSTTKTMAALVTLVLAHRGVLDLQAPVARYWPEFGANGKDTISIANVLSHQAGVPGWDLPFALEDVLDWQRSTQALESQAPWWPPGSAAGYHVLTQGHILGELARRVTGRSLGRFFAEEIADPLGADFHIGLGPEDIPRVSSVEYPRVLPLWVLRQISHLLGYVPWLTPRNPTFRTYVGPAVDLAIANTREWRIAEVPSGNGHGNARAMARIHAPMANGGALGGTELLSPAIIEQVFVPRSEGRDLVLGSPFRWGLGFALHHPRSAPFLPKGRVCTWGGAGGSLVVIDADRKMTFAYAMNRMIMSHGALGCPRSIGLVRAAYRCLDPKAAPC